MSLEAALAANTAAITTLIAAIEKLDGLKAKQSKKTEASQATVGAQPAVTVPATENGASSTPEKSTPPCPVEAVAQEPAPAAVTAAPAAESVTYADLQKVVLELCKTDKPTAVALLADYGVKKATELKEAQYAEVMGKFNAALAG